MTNHEIQKIKAITEKEIRIAKEEKDRYIYGN